MNDPAPLPPPGKLPDEPFAIAGVDGTPLRLEELVDRRALAEMITSFEQLFGVPIRVLTAAGKTLAGNESFSPLCGLVNEQPAGERACGEVLDIVKHLDFTAAPISATVPTGVHRCFTGAQYRVIPLEYDRRPIGRILLGPYLLLKKDGSAGDPPASLAALSPELGSERSLRLWAGLPSADADTIEQLGRHVATVLDVILFSGHKALLTSQMHLASVRESYRELCEKNERLEEAYERLKELDRLKSNFLATVSHELRTPLTSIMGYGEMLAEGVAGELNEEQREFVETIRNKSEQLLGLIMSLLDLSKLESGTVAVRMARLPISTVLADTISTLTPTALKKGVALEIDAAPELPPVLGDAERLRQVFLNLADNALKFTPAGGTVGGVHRDDTIAARAATAGAAAAEKDQPWLYRLPRRTEVRGGPGGPAVRARQRALQITRRGAWSRHCGAALPWHLHRRVGRTNHRRGLAAGQIHRGAWQPGQAAGDDLRS